MRQQPLALYLNGGLGLLPLAPLCQLPDDLPVGQALQKVVYQIDQRLAEQASHALAVKLMTATRIDWNA